MGKFIDLTGEKFGRLLVLSILRGYSRILWECQCDCGNTVEIPTDRLKSGETQSCGCIQREYAKNRFLSHGNSETRLYRIWSGMIQRCSNPNRKSYENYGGRGITVCAEWKNGFEKFRNWALINGYTDNLTIERIDVNGDYCPENCTWIPASEQYKNRRKIVHSKSGAYGVTYNKTSKSWQARIGINGKSINLGFYKNIENAEKARQEAEIKYGV